MTTMGSASHQRPVQGHYVGPPTPPPDDTAQAVADQFVTQYYHVKSLNPTYLPRFYNETSMVTVVGSSPGRIMKAQGQQEIHNVFVSMNFDGSRTVLDQTTAQVSQGEGILVSVNGHFYTPGSPARSFSQAFFLAVQEKGYYVLNDMLYLGQHVREEAAPQQPSAAADEEVRPLQAAPPSNGGAAAVAAPPAKAQPAPPPSTQAAATPATSAAVPPPTPAAAAPPPVRSAAAAPPAQPASAVAAMVEAPRAQAPLPPAAVHATSSTTTPAARSLEASQPPPHPRPQAAAPEAAGPTRAKVSPGVAEPALKGQPALPHPKATEAEPKTANAAPAPPPAQNAAQPPAPAQAKTNPPAGPQQQPRGGIPQPAPKAAPPKGPLPEPRANHAELPVASPPPPPAEETKVKFGQKSWAEMAARPAPAAGPAKAAASPNGSAAVPALAPKPQPRRPLSPPRALPSLSGPPPSNGFKANGRGVFPRDPDEISKVSIFVRGILETTEVADLAEMFKQYGTIKPQPKGIIIKRQRAKDPFAYVEFESPAAVDKVLLNPPSVEGKVLYVMRKRPMLLGTAPNSVQGRMNGRGNHGPPMMRNGPPPRRGPHDVAHPSPMDVPPPPQPPGERLPPPAGESAASDVSRTTSGASEDAGAASKPKAPIRENGFHPAVRGRGRHEGRGGRDRGRGREGRGPAPRPNPAPAPAPAPAAGT